MRSLYAAYQKMIQKYNQLAFRYDRLYNQNENLLDRVKILDHTEKQLRKEVADYERVKSVLGESTVAQIVQDAKEKEQMRKERWRGGRDAR